MMCTYTCSYINYVEKNTLAIVTKIIWMSKINVDVRKTSAVQTSSIGSHLVQQSVECVRHEILILVPSSFGDEYLLQGMSLHKN